MGAAGWTELHRGTLAHAVRMHTRRACDRTRVADRGSVAFRLRTIEGSICTWSNRALCLTRYKCTCCFADVLKMNPASVFHAKQNTGAQHNRVTRVVEQPPPPPGAPMPQLMRPFARSAVPRRPPSGRALRVPRQRPDWCGTPFLFSPQKSAERQKSACPAESVKRARASAGVGAQGPSSTACRRVLQTFLPYPKARIPARSGCSS